MKPAIEVFKPKKFKKASEALAFALKIIRNPKRWVEGYLAVTDERDDDGDYKNCSTKSKYAVAFCALGAVRFVNGPAQKSAEGFLREAGKAITRPDDDDTPEEQDIFDVNDNLGHEKAIQMFKLAIKKAKKAGK
jgi:hypothetical protein